MKLKLKDVLSNPNRDLEANPLTLLRSRVGRVYQYDGLLGQCSGP